MKKTINLGKTSQNLAVFAFLFFTIVACKDLKIKVRSENKIVPTAYTSSMDSTNSATVRWSAYFDDNDLNQLIDSALANNQELNIVLQEIQIAKNEVRAKKGEYLPFVNAGAVGAIDKVARNTSQGASDAITQIAPGKATPEVLPNYMFGVSASWEVDIWQKLRNAKKSAFNHFLGSIEGKNFLVTNLISEIAHSYYELVALDNQLEIVKQNIEIQTNALRIVRLQKEAARVTELAVRKFEAEVYKTRSLQFDIQQSIVEVENRLNFLVGRYPQPVARNSTNFNAPTLSMINAGIPSQLLANRTDIKQAELELVASKLDVKVARAQFYPSLRISGGVGYQAFNPRFLLTTPQSLIFSLAGDLIAPVVNRNAIKANYFSANSKQLAAVFNYERTILNAYIEVVNQMAKLDNLSKSYELKGLQVQALNESISLSTDLFQSARADYMEILMTQRDAIESKFDLVETKKQLMHARVNIYRSLGGGWK